MAALGSKRIRVHALSPGPLESRAAGIEHFPVLTGNIKYIDAGCHILA